MLRRQYIEQYDTASRGRNLRDTNIGEADRSECTETEFYSEFGAASDVESPASPSESQLR